MTKKEYAEKNIGVTLDFLRHLIDAPDVVDTIPDGAELDFIDKDMPAKIDEHVRRKKVEKASGDILSDCITLGHGR